MTWRGSGGQNGETGDDAGGCLAGGEERCAGTGEVWWLGRSVVRANPDCVGACPCQPAVFSGTKLELCPTRGVGSAGASPSHALVGKPPVAREPGGQVRVDLDCVGGWP